MCTFTPKDVFDNFAKEIIQENLYMRVHACNVCRLSVALNWRRPMRHDQHGPEVPVCEFFISEMPEEVS